MTKYSKFNIVYQLQKWMDSVSGQTFLNYAYSWGASIVILGTLFKLTHLPGANFFLFLGMGTEVVVFFISAFDRPFDKTTDGMELKHDRQYDSEQMVIPVDNDDCHCQGGEQNNQADADDIQAMTQHRLERVQRLCGRLPDNEDTLELKKTLSAIHEVYKLQLTKASGQMSDIEEIDGQLKTMTMHLKELNRIYARMIEAVKQ